MVKIVYYVIKNILNQKLVLQQLFNLVLIINLPLKIINVYVYNLKEKKLNINHYLFLIQIIVDLVIKLCKIVIYVKMIIKQKDVNNV